MTLECAHAAKLTVPIRECSDHMSAKVERLITRLGWSHPSGSARWNATTASKHSSRPLRRAVSRRNTCSRLRDINTWEMSKNGSAPHVHCGKCLTPACLWHYTILCTRRST
jgi:hypothetical protein